MKGSSPRNRGPASFLKRPGIFDLALETAIREIGIEGSPYRKFTGSQPENLWMTEKLMERLQGMSEKRVRREYLKLPLAYQKGLAFVFDTGWPEVDLVGLFFGTICPEGSLLKGAEALAEEGCRRIGNKALLDPLKLKSRHVPAKELDELLNATGDLAGLIFVLIGQMEQDLRSSLRYLHGDEQTFLEGLVIDVQGHEIGSDRDKLRNNVLDFYHKLRSATLSARRKKPLEDRRERESARIAKKIKPRPYRKKEGTPLAQHYPETDRAMLQLARTLWTEKFLRKISPLLKDEVYLLSHPEVLAKALFLLSPSQRSLLGVWEKETQEIADELKISGAYVSLKKGQCFRRLASVISDLRAYILTLESVQSAPINPAHFDQKPAKETSTKTKGLRISRTRTKKPKKENQLREKIARPVKDVVSGW